MRFFISYASMDRQRAQGVATHLISQGDQVFLDQQLNAGSGYRSELEREISAADKVIVLWTKNSVKSDWVKEEAEAARMAGKLLPVRFRVKPPFGFRELHTPDLSLLADGAAVAAALNVDRRTSQTQPPPPKPGAAADPSANQRSPSDWYQKKGLFAWASRPR